MRSASTARSCATCSSCSGRRIRRSISAPTIENLKSLQNCLGDLNDAQVQEDLLRQIAPRLVTAGGATADSLVLVGRLIERSHRARRSARRRCEDRFGTLAAKDNRRRIRSLANH